MEFIKVGTQSRVGTISFDHYAKRNALSKPLTDECLEALAQFQKEGARVVILRSATAQKVWSAGHDVDELPQANRDPLPYDDPLEELLRAVTAFPGPVIAMVQGTAWGGACDLIITCDIVFGRRDLRLCHHPREAWLAVQRRRRAALPQPTAVEYGDGDVLHRGADPGGACTARRHHQRPDTGLKKPVSLDAIKADPRLAKMALVTNARLSVQPVSDSEWDVVRAEGGL